MKIYVILSLMAIAQAQGQTQEFYKKCFNYDNKTEDSVHHNVNCYGVEATEDEIYVSPEYKTEKKPFEKCSYKEESTIVKETLEIDIEVCETEYEEEVCISIPSKDKFDIVENNVTVCSPRHFHKCRPDKVHKIIEKRCDLNLEFDCDSSEAIARNICMWRKVHKCDMINETEEVIPNSGNCKFIKDQICENHIQVDQTHTLEGVCELVKFDNIRYNCRMEPKSETVEFKKIIPGQECEEAVYEYKTEVNTLKTKPRLVGGNVCEANEIKEHNVLETTEYCYEKAIKDKEQLKEQICPADDEKELI